MKYYKKTEDFNLPLTIIFMDGFRIKGQNKYQIFTFSEYASI